MLKSTRIHWTNAGRISGGARGRTALAEGRVVRVVGYEDGERRRLGDGRQRVVADRRGACTTVHRAPFTRASCLPHCPAGCRLYILHTAYNADFELDK